MQREHSQTDSVATGRRGTGPADGFTLVEVLVAMVILATGIVLVLRAFETSLTALAEARDALQSTLLIRNKIAEVEAEALGDASLSSAGGGFSEEYGYSGSVSVTAVDGATLASRDEPRVLHEVTVTVWRTGTDRQRSMTTYAGTGGAHE